MDRTTIKETNGAAEARKHFRGKDGMPNIYLYYPPTARRLIELFRLRRWCWKCNDWARLTHLHRGPIRPR